MTGQLTPYQEEVGKGLLRSCVELAMDGLQVSCCKSCNLVFFRVHSDETYRLVLSIRGNLQISQGSKNLI